MTAAARSSTDASPLATGEHQPTMEILMRLQLALNVRDLEAAIDFYSKMFDATPAKRKPGYANFAIDQPPLKLVLFETPDGDELQHLNHLGVEVLSSGEVAAAEARLSASGLETTGVDDTICCFAEKTETWLESPEGARWEWYVKTGDAETIEFASVGAAASETVCCAPDTAT
jgi:catechol 2,3-dioxygenase-like lactoylglutathione lyase family enzyme